MDTITHTAIGMCLGEAIAGKKLGKKAMLWGAVANNLPDVDVISNLWAESTRALLLHRGFTHSILAAVLFSPILAFAFLKMYKESGVSYRQWLLIFGSGWFLHILIDAFTTYGTGWFEPFSDYRVSLNSIFILDPLLLLPVLVCAIALVILKKDSTSRRKWTVSGITLFVVYLILVNVNKFQINRVVEKNLSAQNIAYDDYMSTPTPLNNFLWYILVRHDDGYKIGYYSIFDKNPEISFEEVEKNDSLSIQPCDPQQVKNLIRFSQHYYCLHLENDTVIFSDMRFGQSGGWYSKKAPFIFNFKMARKCSNKGSLKKGRFEGFKGESVRELFRRMFGKTDKK